MSIILKTLRNYILSVYQFVTEDLWKFDFHKLSPIKAFFLKQVRIVLVVLKKFSFDRMPVRASGLVYATLMSIVPLLAVVFSLLKGFGYHNELQPFLEKLLQPLGGQAVEMIVPTIIGFVENVSVAALGAVGFFILLLSSISIVNTMERSFNDIWLIQKSRNLKRKITDYLSILILGPVLALTVLAVTASLQNYAFVRTISENPLVEIFANGVTPFVTSWIVFTFLFVFIPNTKVRFLSALYGALIAGTLWQLMNFFFTEFIVYSYQSGTKAALYASFAVIPLFLIWLYFSWLIVLLGTAITYVQQNLKSITWEAQTKPLSWDLQESLALKLMLFISQKFYQDEKAPSSSELAAYVRAPQHSVVNTLSVLSELELVNIMGRGESRYAPAHCLESMSLRDILQKFRSYGVAFQWEESDGAIDGIVADILNRHEKFLKDTWQNVTIRDLVAEIDIEHNNS